MKCYLVVTTIQENIGRTFEVRTYRVMDEAKRAYVDILKDICSDEGYEYSSIDDEEYMENEGIYDLANSELTVYGDGKIIEGKAFMETDYDVSLIELEFK